MTTTTYPKRAEDGRGIVWACCESSIGPMCQHRRMPGITVYDAFRAVRAGIGARITHPGDGGAPWELRDILWTDIGLSLRIKRDDRARDESVYFDMR